LGSRVEILITTPSTFRNVKQNCGYGLTHIGRLQKEDGTAFDGKKAKEMLHALHLFLSLAAGWTAILFGRRF